MAKDFRYPDRDQGFLLPPDVREWLPGEHLVWMVIEVVGSLDLRGFRRRARLGGAGRAPIDPGMLLALLIYAYAHGVRSSRQVERLCETDVAFRVICGNDAPDHTVIARFRAGHEDRFAEVFAQVVVLCARAGLGKFGMVAIDGTKIAANAAKAATRSEASLRAEARRMLDEAAEVDAAEDAEFGSDARGDELPPELADPSTRKARIAEVLAQIEAEKTAEAQANRVAARVDAWQRRVEFCQRRHDEIRAEAQQRWARRTGGEGPGRGRRPVRPEADSRVLSAKQRLETVIKERDKALAKTEVAPRRMRSTTGNTTDPDSRLLPVKGGFVQGFNAQLAVTADQLIVAVSLSNHANDTEQFVPMMAAATAAATTISEATGRTDTTIGTVLADAGYFSQHNLTAAGPDRLIAANDRRRHNTSELTSGEPPPDATPAARMRHRVATEEGRTLYRRRSATIEPVNGHLKDRTGLRTFARRGLTANLAELNLSCAVLNLLKLHRAAIA
jgi:transposase